MKITAPISKPYEVPILAQSGAEEFYCGVVVDEWIGKYDISVWMNRRSPLGANLRGFDELAAVTANAREFGYPVFLTLNSHYYTGEQAHMVVELAKKAADAGVDSFIVGDPGLVKTLSKSGFEGRIFVSTIGSVLNSETARFFVDLGARRIILPRQMTLEEVENIVRSCPDIEFETFIFNDRCPFLESNCHTLHGLPGQDSFCHVEWEHEFIPLGDGGKESEEDWYEHLEHHKKWLWASRNCNDSYTLTKVPNGTCGLCAIPDLMAAGITSVKIVGREVPDYRKMLSVKIVAKVLEKAAEGLSRDDVREAAVTLRGDESLCRLGYLCYYREANPFLSERVAAPTVFDE